MTTPPTKVSTAYFPLDYRGNPIARGNLIARSNLIATRVTRVFTKRKSVHFAQSIGQLRFLFRSLFLLLEARGRGEEGRKVGRGKGRGYYASMLLLADEGEGALEGISC